MVAIDDAGFREVFDRTLPLARRLAARITGDPALADELAAEALTRLFARWPRLRHEPWVDAWVMRVTTNLALSAVRRGPAPVLAADAGADAAEVVVLRRTLVEALARLPRRQREVVVLRHLSDLSEHDVAAVLGLSAGSVKTHLHRGLAALRGLLDPPDETEVHLADR